MSDLNYRIDASFDRHGLDLRSATPDVKLPPAIEEIALAWARRELGVAAARTADPERVPRGDARALDRFDTSLAPRQWSEEQLRAMAARMRSVEGVAVLDRRHLLATYAHCFVGREAVDWLVRELSLPRHEAAELGRRLLALGCFHHVLDEHGFRDGHFFYRFPEDEPTGEGVEAREARGESFCRTGGDATARAASIAVARRAAQRPSG